jgi:hypothetical protein
MQVKRHDIRGGEGALGEIGQEEFIDHAEASDSDLPFFFLLGRGGMGRHNDAHEWAAFAQALIWAVVKRAADPPFGTAQVLIEPRKCKRAWTSARSRSL